MKLHLGCGQKYLEGYVNIDFPSSHHTVQEKSVADLRADILDLCYPAGSVEEVRLHHVFEHFSRPVACALLAGWHSWLVEGGALRIEVPDFGRTALAMLNPFASMRSALVAERHIFGSHEAGWACHLEGYTPKTMRFLVGEFGFRTVSVARKSWRGTYNFDMTAAKAGGGRTEAEYEAAAERYLRNFMLDDGRKALLDVWMAQYREQSKRLVAEREG